MSAATLSQFVWILLIIIIAIVLIFVLFKLLDRLFLAPLAYASNNTDVEADREERDIANQDEPNTNVSKILNYSGTSSTSLYLT